MAAVDPVFSWIARAALASLFAASAAHKLRDPRAFAESVRDYEVVPSGLAAVGAPLLIALEAATAVALLLPAAAAPAAATGFALLVTYSAAIALNLARGRTHIDCGCLGPAGRQPITPGLLVRNAVLLAVALLAAGPVATRPLEAVDALSIAGGLATAVFLFLAGSALAGRAFTAQPRPERQP